MTLEQLVKAKLVHPTDYVYIRLEDAEKLAKEYFEAGTSYLSVYTDHQQALFIEVIESQGFILKKISGTSSQIWLLFKREFGK